MAENILLHTEHLSKKFGEQFILKDISLDVKKSRDYRPVRLRQIHFPAMYQRP